MIEKCYETTYRILEKSLEDQYTVRKKNFDDIIATLEELVYSQSKQLSAHKQEICDKDSHIRDLQYEIAGLKQRMVRVAEMAGVTGNERNEGNEKETGHGSHCNSEPRGNMNTITKPEMPKSDLRFRQEKELPRRPTVDATAMIHEIDDLIDGLGSRPGTSNPYAVMDFEKNTGSPSSMCASSKRRRSATKSPRLSSIDESRSEVSNNDLDNLPFHNFNPITIERVHTESSLMVLPPRPVSLASENTHPLLRQISLPRALSSDYPRGRDRTPLVLFATTTTPIFPAFIRKETFIEKLTSRQRTPNAPEPQQTPTSEPDSIIRAKVRTEVERRKAVNFSPGDRVKKSDIVHTVVLLPTESPEIQPMKPGTKVGSLAEVEFKKLELGLGRIASDSSKKTGIGLKNVVRRLKSEMWGQGSTLKGCKSPASVASGGPTTDSDDSFR